MKKATLFTLFALAAGMAAGQVTNGLVAKYSFNGGNANDEVGTNHGTVTAATLTGDRFGNPNMAYDFNGAAYINCGNGASIQALTTQYSISAWFNRSTFPADFQVIAAKWATNPASEHFFLSTRNENVAWAAAGPGNAGTQDPQVFPLGDWNHVVFNWDSTGLHQIYFNNTLSTNTTLAPHTVNVTSPVDFHIGAMAPGNRNFIGMIDDVRIYGRILNILEVDSLFNEGNPALAGADPFELGGVSLFPNPASGFVNLRFERPFLSASAVLMNAVGQVLSTTVVPTPLCRIDLPEVKGIYFVRVTVDGVGRTFKVVRG